MNRLRWLLSGALVLAGIAGTAVVMTATPRFEATAQVLLKRPQLERAGGASEESKNRWVWVRDGLELKHHLVSEPVLTKVADELASKGHSTSVAAIRRTLSVHYSGGDDNIFTIRVKDTDARRAATVAESLLNAFPALAVGQRQEALAESITSIGAAGSTEDDEATKARRAEIIETLKSDLAFAKAENNKRIVIIERGSDPKRVWPRPLFIYVAAGIIALFLASLAAVILRQYR